VKYPNLRYGDPAALAYYTQFYPAKDRVRMLAKQLRRSERSVRDWLTGTAKVPWWVPEIVRLQRMEHVEMMRQMNMRAEDARLGVVTGTVIDFSASRRKSVPQGGQSVPAGDSDRPATTAAEC